MPHRSAKAGTHRLDRLTAPTLRWGYGPEAYDGRELPERRVQDCGWGRLIFAHTFAEPQDVVAELRAERRGQRDIAFYLRDPHVVLALAPQDLFLDPSHTFRLWLSDYRPGRRATAGFQTVRVVADEDIEAVNRIYGQRNMVPVAPGFLKERRGKAVLYLAAKDAAGAVLGVALGVDHVCSFDDPEGGSSLWSLAVDPQATPPGVGEALVRKLAETFKARGRAYMDLSVLHDNAQAIALYDKLGFVRIPVFAIKRRNQINEQLYVGPAAGEERLNVYARILTAEARRRGVRVEVLDAEAGYVRYSLGGRSVTARESLSELTSAVAMSRCDDKAVTRRVLAKAGLAVPAQAVAGEPDANAAFLAEHGRVVVKPARGEQGAGVVVDLRTADEVEAAVAAARRFDDTVLLEAFVAGLDLRVIVIDGKVVAAAVRKPARVTGDGESTLRALIERQSRRRARATGGESTIPLDGETERCVRLAGYRMDDVLPEGETLAVRKTANLHTGGTMHDVTERLHPALVDAAVRGAAALEMPLVGFDFMVPAVEGPDYAIIEANERPGLANHEPQPTAERFIDLLFPQTRNR